MHKQKRPVCCVEAVAMPSAGLQHCREITCAFLCVLRALAMKL